MSWYVEHFDDYHEIESKTHKTLELGCFPVEDYSYRRYFGLFYKGRRPAFDKVFKSVLKKAFTDYKVHGYSGKDITCSPEELEQEVKEHMGLKHETSN